MVESSEVESELISEIRLEPIQARAYLLVTCHGRMSSSEIATKLDVSLDDAHKVARELVALGAFIDFSETEFEAMHPRFTAVNMYRRMCKRENIEFKRNKIVDNIGVILEKSYDDARTK